MTDIINQYLTFQLDQEVFSLEISQVREVLDFTKITRVPRTPPFMRGMINLRGAVVPVADLKLKFGMGKTDKSINSCIIIVELALDGEYTLLGLMADSVNEVIELATEQIKSVPRIGTYLNTEFIKGMGKRSDEDFIIILDIEKVFSSEEISQFQEVQSGGRQVESASSEADEPQLETVS